MHDRAIRYGMLTTLWSVLSAFVTAPLIIVFLSPHVQGYFYMFRSVLEIQSLFVLGMGLVIQQFTSHEWEHAAHSADARARLAGIRRFALAWYAATSLLTAVGLGAGGYLFILWSAPASPVSLLTWMPPWFAVCVAAGAQMMISPALVFLQGANCVAAVKRIQLVQGIAQRTAQWIVLALGGKLWLFAAGTVAVLVTTLHCLQAQHRSFFERLFRFSGADQINWRTDIWPLQWRFATSWIAGYVKYSMLIPVLFTAHGPVLAGKMGLTWAMLMVIQRMAGLVVTTRVPAWAMAGARRDYRQLNRMFRVSILQSVTLLIAGLALLWSVVYLCHFTGWSVADRILAPLPTFLLALAFVPENLKHAMVNFIWAQKKEPFWLLSLSEAGIGMLVLPVAGVRWSVMGLAAGFLVMSLVTTVVTTAVFIVKRPAPME